MVDGRVAVEVEVVYQTFTTIPKENMVFSNVRGKSIWH